MPSMTHPPVLPAASTVVDTTVEDAGDMKTTATSVDVPTAPTVPYVTGLLALPTRVMARVLAA